jgi:subtilisin-like proprotein convertase family protein
MKLGNNTLHLFFLMFCCIGLAASDALCGQLSGNNYMDITIPDAEPTGTWSEVYLSGAPDGSIITSVEYELMIADVAVSDIELELESPYGSRKVIWPQGTGNATDAGFDDDADDDNDIYLYWRVEGSFFDGEDPNGWWYLNAWDLVAGDEGHIDYFRIRVNYYYEGGDDWAIFGRVGCFIGTAAQCPPSDLYKKGSGF